MISTAVELHGRLVTIDGNGWLHSAHGEPVVVIADQLFAVSVFWTLYGGSSWAGWLSTISRHFLRFGVDDLGDPAFHHWLQVLPGWDHARLTRATTSPGLHLVWRCSTVREFARL
jgi:hypothetical protein